MTRVELMNLDDGWATYKYHAWDNEEFGIVMINMSTGELKIIVRIAEDAERITYASKALGLLERFFKANEYPEKDVSIWM